MLHERPHVHLKAQTGGSRAVMLVVNGLPTTKEWRVRLQITGGMVITTHVCRRWFKEPNGSLFILHLKILTGVGLSEMTDPSADLSSIPTSTSCGSAHHLQPPRKRCCCSSRGNTLEGSFYICHRAKLFVCPKGKWVTQTYAHHVWFLSPPLLGFYKAMEQQRGEKEGGGGHLVMLYQILLMIIIKHSELEERQKESLYPDGTWTALQTNMNNVTPTTFSPQECQ